MSGISLKVDLIQKKAIYLHDASSVYSILPLCCARCLGLRLAGWLPCWESASSSAFRVCCRKMLCYVLCVFFLSILRHNLIASIAVHLFYFDLVSLHDVGI